MNNRRTFLKTGAVLAGASTLLQANQDQNKAMSVYLHGMVWNRQLPAPMNDWLVRLDAKADIPVGNTPPIPTPGFATLGDDFHDPVGSHAEIRTATLQGAQLTLTGVITESKTAGMVSQTFRVEGKVQGTAVEDLTVTIGDSTFTGAGLILIYVIVILIG